MRQPVHASASAPTHFQLLNRGNVNGRNDAAFDLVVCRQSSTIAGITWWGVADYFTVQPLPQFPLSRIGAMPTPSTSSIDRVGKIELRNVCASTPRRDLANLSPP